MSVFFDGVNVNEHCVFEGGTPVTDGDGSINGQFTIPPNTFIGDNLKFELVGTDDKNTSAITDYVVSGTINHTDKGIVMQRCIYVDYVALHDRRERNIKRGEFVK